MNINQELFKRTGARKKLGIINSLTDSELLQTSEDTIKRILKEAGHGKPRSRNKHLGISSDYRSGNDWNSNVVAVNLEKGELWMDIYVQYSNTDTTTCERYNDFFKRGVYRGHIVESDRYGNPQTYYFNYSEEDKARVIKSILRQYIFNKYKL